MRVYRIGRTEHIEDLGGTGARLYGGRWNHRGVPLVYTSESRALATVEFLAHVSLPDAPSDLGLATIEIPAGVSVEQLDVSSLPRNWRGSPAPVELANLGTDWAHSMVSLLLRVPSAIVAHEHNILINPEHDDMRHVRLDKVERYRLDERLLQ